MSEVKDILSKYKTIAMIGVSKDPTKPSTIVMKYMQKYGFKVIPVNPRAKGEKILGEEVFEKITDIKERVEIVDVFRPSKEAYDIAADTVKIGAKVLWLQLGIKDENAKELVEKNDIEYIENKCTKMEYQKFFLGKRQAFPCFKQLMNIINFTPITATVGGMIIGLAVVIFFLFNGRLIGISGIAANALSEKNNRFDNLLFLIGLVIGPILYTLLANKEINITISNSLILLIIAGLLVGIGTRISGGCTSGHGISGVGRFSLRSIIATITFMIVGILTVLIKNYI